MNTENSNHFSTLFGPKLAQKLKNCSISVVGLGKSGLAAVRLLKRLKAKIFVSESQKNNAIIKTLNSLKVPYETGFHSEKILRSELIIVSPGIPLDLPIFLKAKKLKIPIWNEFELGYRLTSFKKIAAVTGTNGKTTTVSLIGDICKRNGWKTIVAGNIGKPLSDLVLSASMNKMAVLELSSYQLEGLEYFHPDVSVVLNLTPDHLHRHKTMNCYARAKEKIMKDQTVNDFAVLNADDSWCRKMNQNKKVQKVWFSIHRQLREGVYYHFGENKIIARFNGKMAMWDPPKNLLGLHNIENACAAIACALKLGVKKYAIQESMEKFTAVEHRLEKVREINGVIYINDSKATNVDSTLKAIDSFKEPLWLILGGEDKGSPYTPIKKMISQRIRLGKGPVRGILLIGEASQKIFSDLKGIAPFYFCKTMELAVKKAYQLAQKGEVVLLAPACASFDQYRNFEERGSHFKQIVLKIGK